MRWAAVALLVLVGTGCGDDHVVPEDDGTTLEEEYAQADREREARFDAVEAECAEAGGRLAREYGYNGDIIAAWCVPSGSAININKSSD